MDLYLNYKIYRDDMIIKKVVSFFIIRLQFAKIYKYNKNKRKNIIIVI